MSDPQEAAVGVATPVFDAHVGRVGDLGDQGLVRQLVNFYEFKSRTELLGSRIQSGEWNWETSFPEYAAHLAGVLEMAVLIEENLRCATEHFRHREREVVQSDDAKQSRIEFAQAVTRFRNPGEIERWRRAAVINAATGPELT